MIHIGHIIKEVFEMQPRSCTVTWLAGRLHCRRGNIYDIFNRASIDSELLWRLSKVLNHDFFADLSQSFASETEDDPPEQSVR